MTPDVYEVLAPGLSKALRNIYTSSLPTLTLVVQSSGSRYKVEAITTNEENSKFLHYCKQISDRKYHFNLYPLLKNSLAVSWLNSSLKKMQIGDITSSETLYLSFNFDHESVEQIVTSMMESEFETEQLRQDFIRESLKNGEFICLQARLSRVDEPDMNYLNPELSYISSYAIHRGKQIEQDIWSVAGLVQLFDITQETLIRHQIITSGD